MGEVRRFLIEDKKGALLNSWGSGCPSVHRTPLCRL